MMLSFEDVISGDYLVSDVDYLKGPRKDGPLFCVYFDLTVEGMRRSFTLLCGRHSSGNLYLTIDPLLKDRKKPALNIVREDEIELILRDFACHIFSNWPTLWNNIAVEDISSCIDIKDYEHGKHSFKGMNLQGVDFSALKLDGYDFEDCNLVGASFENSSLVGARFEGADIHSANFKNTDLKGAIFNSFTKMTEEGWPNFTNAKASSDTLVILREKKLPVGQLIRMEFEDNLADLKREFGGFWGALHLASVLLFVLPYFYFLIYVHAHHFSVEVFRAIEPGSLEPLWVILLDEITRRGFWSVFVAELLVLLNVLRFLLLIKTKKLEHEVEVTGLPSSFSFQSSPLVARQFHMMRYLTWANYGLVVVHLLFFLQTPLVVP